MRGLLILLTVLTALSCVPKTQQGQLTVIAVPTNPILIPKGNGTTLNGEIISPPYFIVSQLIVGYPGALQAQVLYVELTKSGSGGTVGYTCTAAGDDLRSIFSDDLDSNGQVVIAAASNIQSSPFACQGIPVTNPDAANFNIQLTIKVTAAIYDSANPLQPTGRAIGTTTITVQ
jgi:hypothetical protein